MKKSIERLHGMDDLLPDAHQQQRWVIEQISPLLARAGYALVETPVLEQSDLFAASFGQELWQKLYAFPFHRQQLCLRPEYTASICRLYLDHYQQKPLPLRFQYAGPVFRYEAPARSRYRQHTQLGIELIGGDPLATDAEILQLACQILQNLQISRYRLELGHIGVARNFINRLHLDNHAACLLLRLMEQISRSEEGEQLAKTRLEALYPPDTALENLTNNANQELQTRYITSLLDGISISFGDGDSQREIVERFLWKMGRSEQRRQILQALEFLRALHNVSGSPPEVFQELRALLDRYELDAAPLTELQQLVSIVEQGGVPREQIRLNLSLGRDVSYYTGLVFEIHGQEEDGFATQLCGGGRYDHLLQTIGSPHEVNACGFAFGIERLLALISSEFLPSAITTQALVIPRDVQYLPYALQIAQKARSLGFCTEVDVTNQGLNAGLELAAQRHIPLALIVGEDEQQQGAVTVHDLATGEQQRMDIETIFASFDVSTRRS